MELTIAKTVNYDVDIDFDDDEIIFTVFNSDTETCYTIGGIDLEGKVWFDREKIESAGLELEC